MKKWFLKIIIVVILGGLVWFGFSTFNLASSLFGFKGKKNYLVLLQNNMELRPTGGFMGSYALIEFDKGKMLIQIQDIYVPDGQIKGYVKEPEPIKKYLFDEEHPGWRLRDANWHPDFTQAIKAIDWFFKEGGIKNIDGYGYVNVDVIGKIIDAVGGINIPDYSTKIDSSSFYPVAQAAAEVGFFPGSTQKGDFLRAVTKQLLFQINQPKYYFKISKIVWDGINKHEAAFVSDLMPKFWHKLGFDGSLKEYENDFISINEANLGANKTNCCISRKIGLQLNMKGEGLIHELTIDYENKNPPIPDPPLYFGGGYKVYTRLIVPKSAVLNQVMIDDKLMALEDVDTEQLTDKHKAFGIYLRIEGGNYGKVTAIYTTPKNPGRYSLLWQKQSGMGASELIISEMASKRLSKYNLVNDIMFKL